MLDAGIGSSMDSVDEDIIQALDINEDDIADDEEYLNDDVEEIIIGNPEPFAPQLDLNVDNQVLPEETNEYIHTLEYRTQQLEKELEECDDLLRYNVHDNKPRPSQSLVPYDDMKELEELAADKGLTVEELKQQLLRQLDEEEFDEEEVDTGYEEIQQLQLELADARNEVRHIVEDIDQELSEFLKKHENKDNEKPLAIEDGEKSSETEDKEHESTKDTMLAIEDSNVQIDLDEIEAGPLVLPSALTNMRQFIHQQLKLTDETLGEREKKYKESLESRCHAEEKQLLKNEQQRKAFLQQFREEEAMLIERKKQKEMKIDEEMRNKEGELEEEYRNHQAHIESLIQEYESEKHLYETTCKEIQERTTDRKRNAAIEIQRRYKGFRTRRQMRALIQELDERREARQKEKYELRVMEMQYEINFKAEQAEKEKEEQEKRVKEEKKKKEEEEKYKELEKQKQEEAERIAREIRLEEEKKKKEELEAEQRRQKEKEEERKLEEKKKKEEEKLRKEEEKLRKEEEKKRKEEEKRLKKEQEKKRKEEEKQKQEEEKRHKEEEKKQRMLEEKKQKEEEKRAEQEKRHREMEAKKEKEIQDITQSASDEQTVLSHDYNDKSLTSKSDIATNKLKENAEEDENRVFIEKECVTGDELKDQGSHGKNLHSSENKKAQKEVKLKLDDQSYPTTSSLESETMAEKENCETYVSQESTLNHDVKNQSSDPLHAVKNPPVDPSVPSSNAAIKVKCPEISETIAVAGTQDTCVPSQIPALPVANQVYKPDPIEQLRLEWIKHCLPWSKVSNEPWKLNQQLTGKILKRPSSAKKFPPLSEAMVLAAAQAESLRQVSSVKLSDLPGCSLSTLSQCWSLRYLTITNSGLAYLDGLSACKHLIYLNAENNKIEYVDLKDLGALQCIQLSSNQLTGTSGFEGCINVRWLDLSHNKIRRISGLGTMRRLHTLNLSHNQLTSVDGIDQAVTLQELDLSHNFLQAFESAEKLCLLTNLNLASNNLLQPPVLKNQVLLQWLDLTENSLQSLTKLSCYWLPLLRDLRCGNNRVDFLDGLEKVISLMNLDVSDNQISDLESLKSGLAHCQNLQNFTVQGNPVVDVYASEYRNTILQTVPDLHFINNEPVVTNRDQMTNSMSEKNILQLYQTQIRLHQKLREQFESQVKSHLDIKMSTAEDLCSTIFSYCDTSFKMASEHRSAHEFGDIEVTKSISHFESVAETFSMSSNDLSDSSLVNNHITRSANINGTRTIRKEFNSCFPSSKYSQEDVRAESLKGVNDKNICESTEIFNKPPHALQSSHQGNKTSGGFSQAMDKNKFKSNNRVQSQKIVAVDTDSDDDGKFVDVTKDVEIKEIGKNMYSKIPHPHPPVVDSYLNEKDKFLMALESGSGDTAKSYGPSPRSSLPSTVSCSGSNSNMHLNMSSGLMNSSAIQEKPNVMETAHDSMTAKDKFSALFSGEVTKAKSSPVPNQIGKMNGKHFKDENHNPSFPKVSNPKRMPSVKADVVGSHLAALDREKSQENEFGLDISTDSDFDPDNLDFDLEKYLDMGELDEFLEKGWRPADSPQIPQSNYPVLGRIQDANRNNNSRENGQRKATAVPPLNPQPAWRDSPMSDMRHPHQPSHIPPLPNPCPSPSSVASAAETLGGGSMKSKRDEIAEEWGFKDSRTAQMMMARAKKMKYNAERRRKLNKLDPHQRYQLFRKLEESGKIQHVRPPPTKVLPRKEYFQAREEEAQRQEVERQVEERSRVHRTFEWVHTQVGDHPISTSRINPMPAPVYSNNDGAYGQPSDSSYNTNRKTKSPGSDYLDSASVIRDNFHQQARRFSTDEAFNSQSPVLPPIKINSAPSHHKNDRMSWRDNPMERSAGWGGGKKRSGR